VRKKNAADSGRIAKVGLIWRLNLNGSLRGFFQNDVLRDGTGHTTQQAEKNLLDAKQYFRDYLEAKCKEQKEESGSLAEYLDNLLALITESLGFVWHEVGSEHEVSVIFETMNSRGRPLTQFEKVKNLLFFLGGRYASDEQELSSLARAINDTWSVVLTRLHSGAPETDEDQFLRFVWAIYPKALWFDENQRDRTFDIHKAVKESAKKPDFVSAPLLWINDFLKWLRDYAPIYRDIQKPDFSGSFPFAGNLRNDFIDRCQSIDRIGREANLIPLLMAAYRCYASNATQLNDLKEVFRLVEVFSFRLLLQGRYASTGRSKAFDLAAEAAKGQLPVAVLQDRIRIDLIDYYCNDAYFRDHLLSNRNFYEWNGIRYFLFEYERDLAKGNVLPLDWPAFTKLEKVQTIEHILPQGDNTLANAYWPKQFPTPEIWRDNINCFGNLCITEWNPTYGNKSFPEKCGQPNAKPEERVYRNSKFQSERELVQWSVWTPQAINQRKEKLVQFALRRWKR